MLPYLFAGQKLAEVTVRHVPLERLLEGRFDSPLRLPSEFPPGLPGIQSEKIGFMLFRGLDDEIKRWQPRLYGADDLFHRPGGVEGWSEVPALRDCGAAGEQRFGQLEIAGKRVEHVLPGPNGARASNPHRFAFGPSADAVGNQRIRRPVAAADDIAGASRGDEAGRIREKAAAHAGGEKFGAAFR